MDIVVQKGLEQRETIDVKRALTFTTFGGVFCGAWQYFLFVKTMPRLVPGAFEFAAKPLRAKFQDAAGMRGLFLQCFVENGINNPLLYLPTFYCIKQFINGDPIVEGFTVYKQNMWEDIPSMWAVWVPAQLFNFGFSPSWFRVPYVACVSLLWTAILSATRGAEPSHKESET